MAGAKRPRVNVDILILRNGKILLGLLTKRWALQGRQMYGVPGRDVRFGEHIEETVMRNVWEEFGCNVVRQEVFAINANYALGNHYIGVGVLAEIDGDTEFCCLKIGSAGNGLAPRICPIIYFLQPETCSRAILRKR